MTRSSTTRMFRNEQMIDDVIVIVSTLPVVVVVLHVNDNVQPN